MADKPAIFISYAHNDLEVVRKIHARLTAAGLRPWIDADDILPGQVWLDAIRSAIRRADFFLLCLSPQSIDRRGVLQKEIQTALDVRGEKLNRDIWFLPAWIQAGAPFPKVEMEELAEELRNVQWANLGDPSGWERLLEAIRYQLGRTGAAAAASMTIPPTSASGSLVDVAEPHLNDLRSAVKAGDAVAADRAGAQLEALLDSQDGMLPDRVLRPLLAQLSNRRWSQLGGRLADACIRSGTTRPYVRRCYAEALLRAGFHSAAVELLASALGDTAGDPTERREVTLDLASAHAGRYRMGNPAAAHVQAWIRNAVKLCEEVYLVDPRRNLLHGSVAAALTARASADGVNVDSARGPADTARAILDEVAVRQEVGVALGADDCGAALIAALVIGDQALARHWVQEFVSHPETDPADIKRLSEHVSDAWRDDDQAATLVVLQRALAPTSDRPHVEEVQRPAEALQTILNEEPDFISLRSMLAGVRAVSGIARIETEGGIAIATGFALRGGDLHPDWGNQIVLLANSYVIADDAIRAQAAFSVPPLGSIQVRFGVDGSSTGSAYRVASLLFSSPIDDLAVSICLLDPLPAGIEPLRVAPKPPREGSAITLMGHPLGQPLQVSMGGHLLDRDDRRLHYTTASAPGSSGSPVFNDAWEVVGMHHAGGLNMPRLHGQPGTYVANEGIAIQAIIRALKDR